MSEESRVDVVVLAGAPPDAEMDPAGKIKSRAMILLGDKTMLQWIMNALRASERVGRIAAVGEVSAEGLDTVVEPGENLMENIRRGIEALGSDKRVLVVSSDVPLISSESIDDFIETAMSVDADFAYPIIKKEQCEAKYPGFKRTYLKTGDGTFTGGNIMLVRPDFILRNWDIIARAYGARKRTFELARMIGIGVLFRMIIAQLIPGVLRVSVLERAVGRMLNAKVKAIVSEYPEIGEDVDKMSDVEAVRGILMNS